MNLFQGSHESWGKKNDVLAACPGRNFMLQVCGTTSFNTKAIQVSKFPFLICLLIINDDDDDDESKWGVAVNQRVNKLVGWLVFMAYQPL